jgi:hypothetical protein
VLAIMAPVFGARTADLKSLLEAIFLSSPRCLKQNAAHAAKHEFTGLAKFKPWRQLQNNKPKFEGFERRSAMDKKSSNFS